MTPAAPDFRSQTFDAPPREGDEKKAAEQGKS